MECGDVSLECGDVSPLSYEDKAASCRRIPKCAGTRIRPVRRSVMRSDFSRDNLGDLRWLTQDGQQEYTSVG